MATQLETIAEKERQASIARNEYNLHDGYGVGNKNALSTGDEKGKGDFNGSVGSLTDINTRTDNMGRNEYKPNSEYNSTNPNALSDGDVKGKGQIGDNGEVGGLDDINTRISNLGKNPIYGPNKKSYPDFVV